MGHIIMRNWDLRELGVRLNLPSPIRQVPVSSLGSITPIWGLPNAIRQVVHLISGIRSYPPHCSIHHPKSPSFSSTTLPSSQNTKSSHRFLSLHAMIMSWHRVQAFTKYSIHRVQHPPKIVCLPFILMNASWTLNAASALRVAPHRIDSPQPAHYESSKGTSRCHIPTVAT